MPCQSDYLEPTYAERDQIRLNDLLDEINNDPRTERAYCGTSRPLTRDEMTRQLCEWCKGNEDFVKDRSLEFQMWWRDHQQADAKREAAEREQQRRDAIRRAAEAKLTPEELALIRGRE